MRIISYLIFITFFSFTSCIEDLPELEPNIFEDDSVVLLEIINYTYDPVIGKVEINYQLNFDFTESNAIIGVAVIVDGLIFRTITDVNQDFFIQRNLPINGTRCYQLALLGDGVTVKPTETICIEL